MAQRHKISGLMIMLKSIVFILLGTFVIFPLKVPAKISASPARVVAGADKVRYVYLSQRWLTRAELNRFKDVHGLVLAIRMRLSNESDWYVTYLARSTGSILPEGYQFFRKVEDKEWRSLPPPRGRREGTLGPEFRGDGYRWLELSPGGAIEFEIYDWSSEGEEHSFSAFVKEDPDKEPIEVKSDVFKPLSQRPPANLTVY